MSLKLRSDNSQTFTHIVSRPFNGDGHRRSVGELVDTHHWRNTHLLAMRGYLSPINGNERMSRTQCNRWFTDFLGRSSTENIRLANLKLTRGRRTSLRVGSRASSSVSFAPDEQRSAGVSIEKEE